MPIAFGETFSFDQTLPGATGAAEAAVGETRQAQVVVLGAGLAGLACAYRLAAPGSAFAGPDGVLVLEREAHVGGRTRSLQVGGAVVNLGAVTFQPDHYPRYMALLNELGLQDRVRVVPRSEMVFGLNGRAAYAGNLSLAWDGLKSLAGQGLFTPVEALRLLQFYLFYRRVTSPAHAAEFDALHQQSVSAWAERFGFSPALRRKFVEPFVGYCFQHPDQVSAAFGVFLLGFNLSRPATLRGGFSQVPEAMARRLGERVQTSAVVVAVEREPGGFRVIYQKNGRPHEVRARKLVAAVPANVAAQLLPEMREKAAGVRYGNGRATLLRGRLKQPFALHLRRTEGPGGWAIWGGEASADGGSEGQAHLLNVLCYGGRFEPEHVRPLMVDGRYEVLGEYELCPAVAAPRPGQQALPVDWGDGLYLAGDCAGPFPSQETAVSSGEEVARRLLND